LTPRQFPFLRFITERKSNEDEVYIVFSGERFVIGPSESFTNTYGLVAFKNYFTPGG
jgi:hypothetical protein